ADFTCDVLEEGPKKVLELVFHVVSGRVAIRELPQRLVEALPEEFCFHKMVAKKGDTRPHSFAIVHHDPAFAIRTEDARYLPDDSSGSRRMMNDPPGPDKVEAPFLKRKLFRVRLLHTCSEASQR